MRQFELGGVMFRKSAIHSAILMVILTSLPLLGSAAVNGNLNALIGTAKPQISITFGQPRRRRWRMRGEWVYGVRERPAEISSYRYRVFPEYYMDGERRRIRYVRYYYRF